MAAASIALFIAADVLERKGRERENYGSGRFIACTARGRDLAKGFSLRFNL